MLKIMVEKWNKNQSLLKQSLSKKDLLNISYEELVKLTFSDIYNADEEKHKLNLEEITQIDDGGYSGTLLYVIPFDTYQPEAKDYLMTYIEYGSCSGCDALKRIQFDIEYDGKGKATDEDILQFMKICKDIICNTIKPYNYGWRSDDNFEEITVDLGENQ